MKYGVGIDVSKGKSTVARLSVEGDGVRIDIWTHLMRGCIINYVH